MAVVDVRTAHPNEADLLLTIQREASLAGFAHIFPPELAPYPDDEIRMQWRRALDDPEVEVWVGELDGEPVGSVSIAGDFFRTLYVLPRLWRSGVGSTLHDLGLERLRARGVTRASLWVLEHNDLARRFYERRGWTPNGETRIVPFPPNPLDLGYSLELGRLSEPDVSAA